MAESFISMTRRTFLGAAAAAGLNAQNRPTKPNIVFILADDLGYGDVGCYGQKYVSTPNIDRLAAEGMRFTQAYAGSTVCAPSRCALMTGLHTGHARIRGNTRMDLQPDDMTIPKLLKQAGYRTALFGKWGLGTAGHEGAPNQQGFDEFFGYLNQQHAHTYYPTSVWENDREFMIPANFGTIRTGYTHDIFADRALDFIGRQSAAQPFFLYLAFTLPHANNELTKQSGNGMEVPADSVAPYEGRDWPQPDKNFAGMVSRLDRDVGRVIDKLKEKGLDGNTLVIFTSDNGPHREGGNRPDFFKSSGPLRGIKRDLYEGGIRVPAIARWAGTIAPGQVSEAVWAFWDILPTAAQLAGLPTPKITDGISIAPALQGKNLPAREYLYWEFHEAGFSQAVRMGDTKAVRRKSRTNPIEIYDLRTDLGETADLATKHPELVAKADRIFKSARTESMQFPIKESS